MKFLKALNDKIELYICIILITLMTSLIFIQVIARYAFGNSLSWSEELARYMFIWLIYLGISYGAKIMKHIKIDAGLKLFPQKMRPYIQIIGDIFFLIFSVFIIITSLNLVQKQITLGQKSSAMQIPMWIIYAAPLVGFTLTAIRQIQTILYRVQELKKQELKEGGEMNG